VFWEILWINVAAMGIFFMKTINIWRFSVAIWLNDAPAIDFIMPADNQKLLKLLDKIRIALKMVVYKAGPTGYTLARSLQKAALPRNSLRAPHL